MPLYHVNPDSGDVSVCKSTEGRCPFGATDSHFAAQREAEAAAEALMGDQFATFPQSKEDIQPLLAPAEVQSLIDELHNASVKYYQQGEDSDLSDEEFDGKLEYLQSLMDSEKYEDLFSPGTKGFLLLEGDPSLGTKASGDFIIEHRVPMLSLGKAKKQEDLYSYLNKARAAGATGFRIQAKLDGLALSVRYEKGAIVGIATRGDGTHGEDCTYLLDDKDLTIKGLERTVSEKEPLEVRGELFFTNDQFKAADDERLRLTGSRFKNSRNSAAGLLKKAKLGIGYPVEMTFATYSVLRGDKPANLETINELGLTTVDAITDAQLDELPIADLKSNEEVMEAVEKFGVAREGFTIPTDGVVIKPLNEAEMLSTMGFTSHHPVSQIAWKYPEATATTVVLGIDLTVGKSGKVTPIARVEPTLLAGSRISNASLHNFNLVYTKNIRVGSVVLIEKANDIIPQVKAVLSHPEDAELMSVPKECPSCGEELTYDKSEGVWPPKTLRCGNVNCDSRNFFALKTSVGKQYLDIDQLSELTLDYFNSIGRVKNVADLYTLKREELANSPLGQSSKGTPRRLGEKRADHILSYIEASKTRPLSKMLPAMSIDLLGPTTAKALEKKLGDIDGILGASEAELAAIDGMGPIRAEKIHRGLRLRSELIQTLRNHGVTFGKKAAGEAEEPATASTGVDLRGKSFAISGAVPQPFANRGAWVDYIEAHGGTFESSPKATTTYMVGDSSDTSSKIKKAVSLGLQFMSASEFTATFGE